MKLHALIAELIGTFTLAFLVHLGVHGNLPLATPVVAALTLGTMVYVFGAVSGTHINPAVTIGLWSIKKIQTKEASLYIIAQFLGGFLAFTLGNLILGPSAPIAGTFTASVLAAEALGTAIFVVGVSSVVQGKAPADAAGLTIGGSLLLGIFAASPLSNGVLNPAVAMGIGSFGPAYIVGPVLGSLIAAWGYRWISHR